MGIWVPRCSTRSCRPPIGPQLGLVRRLSIAVISWGDNGFINATSNHPGGANFCFIDGSVHFIKGSISLPTYWSLGTRADGEVISSDSY